MQTPQYERAIIRGVPDSFDSCIKPDDRRAIDITLAREQHCAYREVLRSVQVELIMMEADEKHPDCCFVEDTAIVIGDMALMLHMGAHSRVGEEVAVRRLLSKHKQIHDITSPATIDGGDVLLARDKLFVGLSQRTNSRAVSMLGEMMSPGGVTVVPVPINGILHLKSACSYLGDGYVLLCRGYFDE
ncbi:MAG: arginine deiminase family protein, partial [Candidatus Latescibacterota bacterium]